MEYLTSRKNWILSQDTTEDGHAQEMLSFACDVMVDTAQFSVP